MSITNIEIEAGAKAAASEMGFDWDKMEDHYSLSRSKQSVRKYWRDVAMVILEAAEKALLEQDHAA